MYLQVGDFIAIATLATNICQALSSSRGSKTQFTSLVKTLQALSQAMLQAETLVIACQSSLDLHCTDKTRLAFLDSVAEGIVKERQACEALLIHFLTRFQGYTEAFVEQSKGYWKGNFAKLTWMGKKSEADTLESRIKSHMQALQLHLHTYCYASMRYDLVDHKAILGSIDQSVGSLTVGFGNMQLMMNEALRRIDNVQIHLPKSLGYAWGPEAPIQLLDGLGRRTLLPLMLAKTPEIFREVLLIMHRDGPGYDKVDDGKYVVSDEDFGGALIPVNKWNDSFQPGRHIGLSFVMKLPPATDEKECPRCKTLETLNDNHPGQRRCTKCNLTFKIDDRERTRAFRRNIRPRPKPRSRHSSPAAPTRRKPHFDSPSIKRTRTIPQDEYAHPYQRVHYERDVPGRGTTIWTKHDSEFSDFLAALPPIHRAAASGNVRMLDELLEDGDNDGMNWKVPSHSLFRHDRTGWDFTGAPPIHFAAYYGHYEAVLFLLSCRADIDGKDAAGTTALHAACWTGNEDLFRRLLKKGANRFVCDYDGWSPSVYAMLQGHISFSKLFAEDVGPEGALLLKIYEIRHAAKQGMSDSVLEILGTVEEEDERKLVDTALLGASEGGHNVLLQKLLNMSANPRACDETGSTALHWAGWGGHTEIGNMQWDSTTSSSTSTAADTPAIRLVQRSARHESLMLLLLEYGTDINAQNCEGCTPLHWVAGAGSVPMIKFFLEHGASVDIKDCSGRTAVERVAETGDEDVATLLADAD